MILAFLVAGCTGIPKGVTPVQHFEVNRYLGRWYEIARLDHSFERGLSHVTAEYDLREGGGLRVLNRGYSARKQQWNSAEGKAFFMRNPGEGYLKVSFFGPFYGSYIVCDLDEKDYQYALVCGPNKSYLWILARQPAIDLELEQRLIAEAAALGFDTSRLVFVDQSQPPPGGQRGK